LKITVDNDTADVIWDILTEHCGASNDKTQRDSFIMAATEDKWTEWRFQGSLGFGGKVWNNDGRFYVNLYREDETPVRCVARDGANEELAKVLEEIIGENK